MYRLGQIGHSIHDRLSVEDNGGITVDAVLHRLGETYRGALDLLFLSFVQLCDVIYCLSLGSICIHRKTARDFFFELPDPVDLVELDSVYLPVSDD